MFARSVAPQMVEEYVDTGKLRYVFKYFPFLGDESYYASEASECAGDQGKFWEYHDLLFLRWQGEGRGTFLPDRLKTYAAELALDTQAFGSCLDSRRNQALVLADKRDGAHAGVSRTPTLILNGQQISSPRDFGELKAIIEEALNEGG